MQLYMQAVNITTNMKVKIDCTLPELSAKKNVTWNCHVDYFAQGRYDIILGIYLLTALGSNIIFSEHIIEADYRPLKRSLTPMVDLDMYEFINLDTGKIIPEE